MATIPDPIFSSFRTVVFLADPSLSSGPFLDYESSGFCVQYLKDVLGHALDTFSSSRFLRS